MKMKGYVNKSEKQGENHWTITFVHNKHKHWLDGEESPEDDTLASSLRSEKKASSGMEPKTITLDNRGLELPQPMMQTSATLDRCLPGDVVQIHNDRVPIFLIEELNHLGCPFEVEGQEDGSATVNIQKV